MKLLPSGNPLPDEVWLHRHRFILGFLWLHVPVILAIALGYGFTLQHALLEVSPLVIFGFAATVLQSRAVRQLVASLGLISAVYILIHVTEGAIEAHFQLFIAVPATAFYQRWEPYLAAIGSAAIHHIGLAALAPAQVFNHVGSGESPWPWVAAHVAAVVILAAVMVVFWAQVEEAQSRATAMATEKAEAEFDRQRQAAERNAEVGLRVDSLIGAAQTGAETVNSMHSSLYDLTSVVNEIAISAHQATAVGQRALDQAIQSTDAVARLGTASAEVGEVAELITSVAQQTNLLSLNATIEAARAGESGKGFAVVANEVKQLANRTAEATDEITARINAIQSESDEAGSAIANIGDIIREIVTIQSTIASAVTTQEASVRHLTERANEANALSGEMAANAMVLSETGGHGGV